MIIDQITLRIKNVIFFKVICVFFAYMLVTYSMKEMSAQKTNYTIQMNRSLELVKESEERLAALNTKNLELNEAVKKYQELQAIKIQNPNHDCFDKLIYQNDVIEIANQLGMKDGYEVFISSNSSARKDQPKESLLLKTTTIKVNYHSSNEADAIKFAKLAYEKLPKYSVLRSLNIIKHDKISPVITKLIDNSETVELITAELIMEVREIELNGK